MGTIARGMALAGAVAATAVASSVPSCTIGSSPGDGDAGVGGCPAGPAPLFTLHIAAASGNLPGDTTLHVRWSAGEEPEFVLSDPSSWGSIEDGANLECAVDRDAAMPLELDRLDCELWTSGTTEIEVSATGFDTVERTLAPATREGCEQPVPSDVTVTLEPTVDGGT